MKKIIFMLLFASILNAQITPTELTVGEEYIEPLKYPKFSISGNYRIFRNFINLNDSSFKHKLDPQIGVNLNFEVGLYEYMNAGGGLGFNIPSMMKRFEPLTAHFTLFAKPLIPIGDRFSVFTKIRGGLTWDIAGSIFFNVMKIDKNAFDDYERVYSNQQYQGQAYGLLGSATVGLEAFITKRLGLSFECGIRTSVFRVEKNWLFIGKKVENVPNAPSSQSFLTYEIPFLLSLNAIL